MDGTNQLATQYIKFPNTAKAQFPIKRVFHSIADLLNTIGVIVCTHVHIKAPSPDPSPSQTIPLYRCSTYSGYVVEQDQLKVAEVGDSVNLSCFSTRDIKTTIVWIKQNPGEKPVEIATSYQQQAGTFYNGFEKSGRFKTQAAPGSFNLTISNLEPSDTAMYYCAVIFIYDITFGEGTVLVVKGAPLTKHKVHQQSVLEAVHPGDSVTLQCTVLTESCSGEHSVYWFRHGSGESHPGIIYTHGNRSDECKKSSETDSPTQSCVYKLPKRNLSLSDAGTYYCAVAACGQILFGNGTDLHITGKV
ncbi:immunoglobulin alpha-2 heavy chain-like [Colossoma macropomum]|uniref:immunoglobulin alpha-2 heavy chain-like n=1 Tax=Colossoma macropomum TaxID=42526 RepID=UPI001864A75A|nr:immunoglobulin alpha-2 heavy chain-like [Colossoma macropomum]